MIPKKGFFIPRTRTLSITPQIWNGFSETGSGTAKWYGKKLSEIQYLFHHKQTVQIYHQKEWDNLGNYIFKKILTQPNFFPKIVKAHTKLGKTAENTARKIFKLYNKSNERQLLASVRQLQDAWITFDQANVPVWFIAGEPMHHYITMQLLETYSLSEKEVETLCAANDLSLPALEELFILQSAINLKKGLTITHKIKYLAKEFGWIPYGYDGPEYWDETFYLNKVTALSKNKASVLEDKIKLIKNQPTQTRREQQGIIKKYSIKKDLRRILEILQKIFILTDERKKIQFQIHRAFNSILTELGATSTLSLEELKCLDVPEISSMFEKRNFSTWKDIAQKRIDEPTYAKVQSGKIVKVETGKHILKYYKKFTEEIGDIHELKGAVGNKTIPEITIGKVKVILSSKEIGKMKQGEILVTSMTTPDFVPAMRKAKAIITDEGGITCHAAIISRELGIPCVIGTKIATKIFKNGDTVEINTKTGIVKKI
jgi:phosphohistidine swiveling domain-containing protein